MPYRKVDDRLKYNKGYKREYRKTPQGIESTLKYNLKRYGITVKEYRRLLRKQKGKCKLCGGKNKKVRLGVDHRHADGKIRGLLCTFCNSRLYVLENKGWLKKAIRYLKGEE